MALFVMVNNQDTLSFNNHTDKHVLIITTANDIASYAKRAEGHVMMYLILNRKMDRQKFFDRMKSLKGNILILSSLQNNINDKKNAEELLLLHDKALISANSLLKTFDVSIKNNSKFNFKLNQNSISKFHDITSNIRRKAVSMVKSSASNLEGEHIRVAKNLDIEKWIIFLTVLMCFSLLFLVILLSKKMNRLSKKLYEFSYTDSLTGIANRREFDEQFDIEWRRSLRDKSSLAFMLIDIDSFKQVNDTHGHSAGDKCLTKIAQTLKSCLKRPTDIIARYGGEEFAIILPNTTEAKILAEQCRSSIDEMNSPVDGVDNLSITIGVGVFNVTPELEKNAVIQKIDQALYRGKVVGKNRVESAVI